MANTQKHIKPVRLRMELISDYLSSDEKVMLKRYGESSSGDRITREVLIPSDMTLHALHYAMQKLFGWQNSHLRQFNLPKDVYQELTQGTVKGWSDLVGVLFQPPSEAEHDVFWDDDYDSGNFNAWLRRKYTGPYPYGGYFEQADVAKADVNELLDRFEELEIQESFSDYLKRRQTDPAAEPKVLGKKALVDMTLDEMNAAIAMESGTESLMETLLITDVLGYADEELSGSGFPVTQALYYEYDYGDSWIVKVTKLESCLDLVADHSVTKEEVDAAKEIVLTKHKPVCLSRDGVDVMDDVGGLSGFANFLKAINETEDKQEAADFKRWARSMGWKQKKVVPKKML
ncbi:hypothetical protein ACEN4P_02435 [Marinilactibacillus psychrotolerans]|uniref:IS1096 element passenger TnpR family protein n=1 Tax=Marinilactibacillus psychrotolerans TaxID=191770 RepID=UPI003883A96C